MLSRTNTLPATVIDELIKHEIPVVLKDGVQLFSDPVAQELISAVAISNKCNQRKGGIGGYPKISKVLRKKFLMTNGQQK